ncbi:MAG: ABC transporter permease, partial [bacterium]|nr:ABC transporter permease [bacterium]
AWGFIALIQPFSAVFYPVSILPQALQYIAYALPSTYVFEGMRSVLQTGTLPLSYVLLAVGLNVLYFAVVVWFFHRMFAYVKREGKLLKLEG